MLAMEAFVCHLAEMLPTTAMGRQAAKYRQAFHKAHIGVTAQNAHLGQDDEADEQPVNTLGTGKQLQHQHFTEQGGVFRHSAGRGLTRHTYANRRANACHQSCQHAAQQGKNDA